MLSDKICKNLKYKNDIENKPSQPELTIKYYSRVIRLE
jgi:hypothetical protein